MKVVQLLNRSLLELPSEVILDILCRLPIKTCLRCKLVCKDWYNIIISHHFADLRRSYTNRVTVMLYCRFPNGRLNFLLLELDNESSNIDQMGNIRVGADCMIEFRSKFDVPNGKLRVVNVCNGLVCLKSNKVWGSYYICNLLTSQFVKIEQFQPRSHALHGYMFGSCPVNNDTQCVSVSRDSSTGSLILARRGASSEVSFSMMHQYKLLRILRTRSEYFAEILTLGSGNWRRVHDAPNFYPWTCQFQAFLNGSVHWYSNSDKGNIWAFHFGIEKFLHIPTPDESKVRPYAALTVFDSCLCLCCVNGNGFTSTESEVWLMKEYGVGHSWVKLLVIHVPKPLWYSPCKPLMRLANGRILISRCDYYLALYDPETRAYEDVKVDWVCNIRRLQAFDADFSWLLSGVQWA